MITADTGPGSVEAGWRRVAAAGLVLEAAVLAGLCVLYAVRAAASPEPAFNAGLAAFFGLVAIGLVPVVRAVARGSRWAVSAALTWQALQTLAGLNLASVDPALGIPVVVAGAGIGIAVVIGNRSTLARRDT